MGGARRHLDRGLAGLRLEFVTVEPYALQIHLKGKPGVAERIAAAEGTNDGARATAFIADERLDSVGPGRVTTMAALELCLAGLWYRASDGYVIADLDLVERLAEPVGRRRMRAIGRFLREYLSPL